jgi:hypothetical protein
LPKCKMPLLGWRDIRLPKVIPLLIQNLEIHRLQLWVGPDRPFSWKDQIFPDHRHRIIMLRSCEAVI